MHRLTRVGHKGADLIEPGNTLASFDAAWRHGVHMIEFDVLPERGGDRLILAHDFEDAASRPPVTLDEGLRHLCEERFDGIDILVDLKMRGYERRVVNALRRHGIISRALVSSTFPRSLALIRSYEPRLRLGWSVPRARRDYTESPLLALPVAALLALMRRDFPRRAASALRAGRCDAIMANWHLVTPALVRSVESAGGELYVWTVDDVEQIQALAAMGVTGVITNDPRLFVAATDPETAAS